MFKFTSTYFDIHQIADSGQVFRWYPQDDGYIVVFNHHVSKITQRKHTVFVMPLTPGQKRKMWLTYLALDEPYEEIVDALGGKDEFLDAAIAYGQGIRILKQDPLEMIVTFILSANNNIKRITNTIEMLSQQFGTHLVTYEGRSYYDFPTIEQLSSLSTEAFRQCGAGYRDRYLVDLFEAIKEGFDCNRLKSYGDYELKSDLLRLNGVGEKVANCILLFGYSRYDGFPIDTWMKKVIMAYYPVKEKDLQSFSDSYFKPYGGIAQQYLFYYGRKIKI